MKIGFSTGTLYRSQDTREALLSIKNIGSRWLELGVGKIERLAEGWLEKIQPDDLKEFDYVSLHAPIVPYGHNDQTRFVLDTITRFHTTIRRLDRVVIHPDPVEDFSVLASAGLPIGLENMDWRKASYRQPQAFLPLFDRFPDWRLVLDVNHIFTNDPTMNLAKEFYRLLGSRITQIHVSGFRTFHDPLYLTGQNQIVEAIEHPDVPLIVESLLSPGDLVKERDYLTEILGERKSTR